MIWFSSDSHYSHENILKLCNRPFESVPQMNEALMRNHNRVVAPDDLVIHLGDFAMGLREQSLKHLACLNGKHILVAGNHDKVFVGEKDSTREKWIPIYKEAGFSEIHEVYFLENEQWPFKIRCHHFPATNAEVQDHDADIRYAKYRLSYHDDILHLSGHTHLKEQVAGKHNIHVGVDAWAHTPVSLTQIFQLSKSQGWFTNDETSCGKETGD